MPELAIQRTGICAELAYRLDFVTLRTELYLSHRNIFFALATLSDFPARPNSSV